MEERVRFEDISLKIKATFTCKMSYPECILSAIHSYSIVICLYPKTFYAKLNSLLLIFYGVGVVSLGK